MSPKVILKNVPDYELEWAINKVSRFIKEGQKKHVYTLEGKNIHMFAGIRRLKSGTIVLSYWELWL